MITVTYKDHHRERDEFYGFTAEVRGRALVLTHEDGDATMIIPLREIHKVYEENLDG